MLVNCNSCQKKFNVPESAITETGRLLQCGSCGNKWTQYPIKQESTGVAKQKKETPKPASDNIRQIPKKNKINNSFKKKKRASINPVGFFVGKNNIYLTTDNGRLLVVDLKIGKTKSIIKIDRNKISRPFILNQNMFLIKEDSIIKLD